MADAALTHKFVSGKADGGDSTLVQPSKWNQNHNFSGGSDGQILQRDSTQTDGAGWIDLPVAGGVAGGTSRLKRNSTTQIQLGVGVIPLKVSGIWRMRPITAAITIGNGSLSSSTLYYVYATDSSGSTVLELSTTGHATDTTFGVEIKSGDATRTLVGMVRMDGSTQFQDNPAQRFTASWFSRQQVVAQQSVAGGPTTTSTTYVELSASLRAEFITWLSDILVNGGGGDLQNSGANGFVFAAVGLDGVSTLADGAGGGQSVNANSRFFFHAHGSFAQVSEGYHYITLGWRVNAGTGTYSGGAPEVAITRALLFM